MAKYGHYRRTHARINVLRGYEGNESRAMSLSAKPKDAEGILSGMVISIDSNGEWIKGAPQGKTPYIAYHDQSDTDVVSSGLLLGLSCAGNYEIETSHIKTDDTYVVDSPLKALTAGDAGKIGVLADLTTDNQDVIGFVTRKGAHASGAHDVSAINSQFGTNAGPNLTLIFRTQWMPYHV